MWKSFYAGSELLELPLLSMCLFIAAFFVAVVMARRIRPDDPRASLPFNDAPSALKAPPSPKEEGAL